MVTASRWSREWSTIVEVVDGDATLTTWRLTGVTQCDVGLIDALARLQLVARRRGWTIRLTHVDPELVALLDLTGLAGVLGAERARSLSALVLEGEREAAGGEALGAEEVVPGGDPAV